jgi:hypothetical protein
MKSLASYKRMYVVPLSAAIPLRVLPDSTVTVTGVGAGAGAAGCSAGFVTATVWADLSFECCVAWALAMCVFGAINPISANATAIKAIFRMFTLVLLLLSDSTKLSCFAPRWPMYM